MERASIVNRAKQILVSPKTEWPLISAEPATIQGIFLNYVVILAALPAIAQFIRGSLIGYSGFGVTVRTPIAMGLIGAIVSYVLSLLVVYVVSLIVNALAPTFEGQQSPVQALKVIAYGWTAAWIGGIFVIVPWIGWLISLAGAIYSIYLVYTGLSPVMKNPEHKSAGYAALVVVIAVVLTWVLAIIVGMVIGGAALSGAAALSTAHPV